MFEANEQFLRNIRRIVIAGVNLQSVSSF